MAGLCGRTGRERQGKVYLAASELERVNPESGLGVETLLQLLLETRQLK